MVKNKNVDIHNFFDTFVVKLLYPALGISNNYHSIIEKSTYIPSTFQKQPKVLPFGTLPPYVTVMVFYFVITAI